MTNPVPIYCPQGLDKDVFHYDNIYPNLIKSVKHSTQKMRQSPLVSKPHQLDFTVLTSMLLKRLTHQTARFCISWLGLPGCFYPSDILRTPRNLIFSETTSIRAAHEKRRGNTIESEVTVYEPVRTLN